MLRVTHMQAVLLVLLLKWAINVDKVRAIKSWFTNRCLSTRVDIHHFLNELIDQSLLAQRNLERFLKHAPPHFVIAHWLGVTASIPIEPLYVIQEVA
jgi:hypothetical protein